MILSPSIRSWFERTIQWVKMNPLLTFSHLTVVLYRFA